MSRESSSVGAEDYKFDNENNLGSDPPDMCFRLHFVCEVLILSDIADP